MKIGRVREYVRTEVSPSTNLILYIYIITRTLTLLIVLYKELAWAKIVLRVKSTKIYTVQNGKKLWEFSKCSSEGLGHDNHLIDILTKRTCLAYMYASTHMVKWSWSLHGMSFHGSPVTHLTHRKGWYKIFQNFSKMYWSLVQTQF